MKKLFLIITALFTIFLQIGLVRAVPSSLPACNFGYRIENNQVVYCDGEKEVEILGADASSFKEIDSSYYAKDNNAVYCDGQKIDADPTTFQLITSPGLINFYKDATSVYFGCTKLKNSDPFTFKNISGDFNLDKSNIYYQGVILEADKNTFEVISSGFAKDKLNVYFRYSKIPGANPATFIVKKPTDYSDYCNGAAVDSMDKNAYYMTGAKVCARTPVSKIVPTALVKNTALPKIAPIENTNDQETISTQLSVVPDQSAETLKSQTDEATEESKPPYATIASGVGIAFIFGIFVGRLLFRKRS